MVDVVEWKVLKVPDLTRDRVLMCDVTTAPKTSDKTDGHSIIFGSSMQRNVKTFYEKLTFLNIRRTAIIFAGAAEREKWPYTSDAYDFKEVFQYPQ